MLKNTTIYKKEKQKSIKQSEIIIYHSKMFENLNTVDIKSIITENRKLSHKLFKTIRQAEKVVSNNSLYGDTKKVKFFSGRKKCKNTKAKTCL